MPRSRNSLRQQRRGFPHEFARCRACQAKTQKSFDRRFPDASQSGSSITGGTLGLARNGGHVFGQLHDRVWGAGICNGARVFKGAIFGKSLAEAGLGTPIRAVAIVCSQLAPSRPIPKWITALSVRLST